MTIEIDRNTLSFLKMVHLGHGQAKSGVRYERYTQLSVPKTGHLNSQWGCNTTQVKQAVPS